MRVSLCPECVREPLQKCRARRRIVILDCCYSARAMEPQAADLVGLAGIDGTFILAAAGPMQITVAPQGKEYTAFTGALLGLLKEGEENAPEVIDLSTTAWYLRKRLVAAGWQPSHCLDEDLVGRLPFVPNAAYAPYPDVAVDDLVAALEKTSHDARDVAGICRTVTEGVVTGLGYAYARISLAGQDGQVVARAAFGDPLPGLAPASETVPGEGEGVLTADGRGDGGPRRLDRRLRVPLRHSDGAQVGVLEAHVPSQRAVPGVRRLKDLETYASRAAVTLTHLLLLSEARQALDRSRAEATELRAQLHAERELREESAGQLRATRDQLARLTTRVQQVERLWNERESELVRRLVDTRRELADRDRELGGLLERFQAASVPARTEHHLADAEAGTATRALDVGPGPEPAARATRTPPPPRLAPAATIGTATGPAGAAAGRVRRILLGTLAGAVVVGVLVFGFLELPLTLTYRSGDRPATMTACAPITQGEGDGCQVTGQKWKIAAGRTVRTVFDPAAGRYGWALRGALNLQSTCSATVRWSVTAGTTTVAKGTLSHAHPSRDLTEKLRADLASLTVTARRTDSAACVAQFTWDGVYQNS
jgi:hypothetical protein